MTRASSYGKFPLLKLFTVVQSADDSAGGTVVTACASPDDALRETYVMYLLLETEPDVRKQTKTYDLRVLNRKQENVSR